MKTEKNENLNSFDNLVKSWNEIINNNIVDESFTETLQNLARASAYSVLKKILEKTANDDIRKMYISLMSDIRQLDYFKIDSTISSAYDLVNTAIVSILDETEKAKQRNSKINFTIPYNETVLNKRIRIIDSENKSAFKTVSKSPIQNVFSAIRTYIYNMESVQINPSNSFIYIEDLASENSENETLIRLPRYTDIGGNVTDYNGNIVSYTAGYTTLEKTAALIEKMNLSEREKEVLKLRYKGYGYKAIARYLNIKQQSVVVLFKRIKEKAIKSGFNPEQISIDSIEKHTLIDYNPTLKHKAQKAKKILYVDIHSIKPMPINSNYTTNIDVNKGCLKTKEQLYNERIEKAKKAKAEKRQLKKKFNSNVYGWNRK